MILAWVIRNWRIALVLAILLAFSGVCSAYLWQRTSLAKVKAEVAAIEKANEEQAALIGSLRTGIAEAKKHQKRVEVIKYKDRIIRETINVPSDPVTIVATPEELEVCKRYVENEKQRQDQLAAVYRGAGLITDFYNGVYPEGSDKIRATILPQTSEAGAEPPGIP
mgnify:CR=1 FL=1